MQGEDNEYSDVEEQFSTSKLSEVYLALVDAPVKESDVLSIEDTFIGGEPVWLHENSVPDKSLLECGACKKSDNMKLLIQAFSPLDVEQVEAVQKENSINNMNWINGGDDDRALYVFICTTCQRKGNSVRCIRGVKKNAVTIKSDERELLSEKINKAGEQKELLFASNPFDLSKSNKGNPFDGNPFEIKDGENSFTKKLTESSANAEDDSKTSKAAIKEARRNHDLLKNKDYDSKTCFKSFLLYVEPETFTNKPDHLKLPKNLKIDKNALDMAQDFEEDIEKAPVKLDPRTEKLSKFLDDDTFQKFQEVVGYNPHQVLRYEFGGKPLYYSDSKIKFEQIVAAPAYNPSSKRVFEMQLMPKMILDLEEEISVEGSMEWGTIMIFTDVANCIPKFDENNVGYVEEVVKVQWEEKEQPV